MGRGIKGEGFGDSNIFSSISAPYIVIASFASRAIRPLT
jgi:hypothetical protein